MTYLYRSERDKIYHKARRALMDLTTPRQKSSPHNTKKNDS